MAHVWSVKGPPAQELAAGPLHLREACSTSCGPSARTCRFHYRAATFGCPWQPLLFPSSPTRTKLLNNERCTKEKVEELACFCRSFSRSFSGSFSSGTVFFGFVLSRLLLAVVFMQSSASPSALRLASSFPTEPVQREHACGDYVKRLQRGWFAWPASCPLVSSWPWQEPCKCELPGCS